MPTVTVTAPHFPDLANVEVFALKDVDYERRVGREPFTPTSLADGTLDANKQISITLADGRYGLLAVVDEVQTVTVNASAGQFKLTFQGQQTADLAFNITAANLKTALAALSNLDAPDLTVSGGPGAAGGGTPYTITFGGQWAGSNVTAMTAANGTTPLSGGTATATVATGTGGATTTTGGPIWTIFTIHTP